MIFIVVFLTLLFFYVISARQTALGIVLRNYYLGNFLLWYLMWSIGWVIAVAYHVVFQDTQLLFVLKFTLIIFSIIALSAFFQNKLTQFFVKKYEKQMQRDISKFVYRFKNYLSMTPQALIELLQKKG